MTHDWYVEEHEKKSALTPKATEVSAKRQRSRKQKNDYSFWLDDPYCPVRGETALWVAVITQAMMDALSKSNSAEALYHKHEAIRWLTDNSKDFILVCMFANLDPDYVRRKAKRSLVRPVAWRAAPGKGKRYQERKAYRQRIKREMRSLTKQEQKNANESNIIVGPWHQQTSL